jgi:dienelactone hydrolase
VTKSMPMMKRRAFVQAACGAAALALPALRAWAEEPAPYEVLEFDWADAKRQRAVPVRLYWPRLETSTPTPLVVFSHGIGGSRRGYRYLGEHWSSHGIASLHLQHVGSDRNLWFGNPLGLVGRLQDAAQEKEAIERPRDLSFALDALLALPQLGERIDAKRLVAAGHSYGANTTLLAAGARVQRGGQAMELRDERIAAAVLLSAPPFYGEGEPARILAPVRVPTLHITATGDVIRIPGYWSGAEDRIAVYEAVGGAHKALAVFEGGSHSMFTDRPGTGGAELNPRVKQATKELSLAFLQARFGVGADLVMARWTERHRAILARHEGLTSA